MGGIGQILGLTWMRGTVTAVAHFTSVLVVRMCGGRIARTELQAQRAGRTRPPNPKKSDGLARAHSGLDHVVEESAWQFLEELGGFGNASSRVRLVGPTSAEEASTRAASARTEELSWELLELSETDTARDRAART